MRVVFGGIGVRLKELVRRQWIAKPLDRVFPFFERPENLALITPPWLRFQICTPSPVPMAEGQIIDYQIRIGLLPFSWKTLIAAYDPPHSFVDEQLSGPYAYWSHQHRFETHGDNTLITDHVLYALPRHLPGRLDLAVHGGFVGPALDRIFNYRARMFEYLFGAPGEGLSGGGRDQ